MSQCQVCEATTGDGQNLCVGHLTELEVDLDRAGEWADTVWETVSRQDVAKAPSERLGGGSDDNPLPFNAGASETLDHLKATLTSWALMVHDEARVELDCTDDVAGIAGYLTANLDWLRKHDAAGDFRDEVLDALKRCERIVDRARGRITVGQCDADFEGVYCPGTMIAREGDIEARCDTCGATCELRARQLWLISEAWHVTAYLPDIVAWLDSSGHAKLNLQKVKNWVHKGKLEPVSREGDRPLYTPAAVIAAYWQTPTGKRTATA